MTQRIERSVDIDAPLSLVYRVIADVAAYPQFLPGVQRVRQEGDRFEMTVRLGPLDVTWTSRAVLVPDTSIDVQLVRGPFRRMDVRWTFGSRSVNIGFNGGNYLGVPVPQWTDYLGSEAATTHYGPVRITSGGLLDGGSVQLRPAEGEPPETDCVLNPQDCEYYFNLAAPDGEIDTGLYYVQGGSFDYGGIALQFGVRYTF